jgi:hypothetical protein
MLSSSFVARTVCETVDMAKPRISLRIGVVQLNPKVGQTPVLPIRPQFMERIPGSSGKRLVKFNPTSSEQGSYVASQ